MKKLIFVFLLLLLASGIAYSQSVGAFAGYGSSAFGDDVDEEAGYVPVGAQLLFGTGGSFELGGEVSYAVVPFTFSMGESTDMKISQLYYGVLAKFKFGTGGGIWPYLRAGGGMYTGTLKFEYSQEVKDLAQAWGETLEDKEYDFKNAFGFNVGAGAEMNFSGNNGLFAEFVYHIVDRELDVNNPDMEDNSDNSMTANNWAIQVGFRFSLK